MGAVAAMVQLVALEDGVVRHVHVERVAHKADVIADDARTRGVVEFHAVATLGGVVIALAGDQVALDHHIVGLFNPQPEQVVGQVAVPHHSTVRAGVDVDAGVLVLEAVARVAHDQAFDGHIGRRHPQRVALQRPVQRGTADAAQCQWLVDEEVAAVQPALDFQYVARLGRHDRLLQRRARFDAQRSRLRAGQQDGQQQKQSFAHQDVRLSGAPAS